MELELTILIPVLNEAGSLPAVLPRVKAAASALTGRHEILVVDGGSSDGTPELAESGGARLLRQKSRGLGGALREGLAAAKGRWVICMDGDGSHPPETLKTLWERREKAELVIGSRYVAGGSADMSFSRYWLSVALNVVSRFVLELPVKDASSGLRLYHGPLVRGLNLSASDHTIQQEILVRLLSAGGRAVEVPFHYEPRLGGISKANVGALAFRYLAMLAGLRLVRGWAVPAALGLVLATGLFSGFYGFCWGIPGTGRLRAFPERLMPSPEVARRFSESWAELYQEIERSHREMRSEEPVTYVQGVEIVEPGWAWPPPKLLNSYRSLLLRSENPDERKAFTILAQMRPWKLEFKPLYVHYGGAFIYPLGAFLQAADWLGAVRIVADLGYYVQNPDEMGKLYLGGRAFVLIFHLGTLLLLFDLGRKLRGPWAGAAAAVLYALSPVVLEQTHTIKPHAYAVFWMLAALRAAVSRRYVLCGALAGFSAASSFALVYLGLLPAAAWLPGRDKKELRRMLGGLAAAALIFAALNPYLFLAFRDFIWEIKILVPPGQLTASLRELALIFPGVAAAGLGALTAGLAAGGVLAALRRPGLARLAGASALLLFAVLWPRFASLSLTPSGMRLFLPVVALGCLLAADLLWAFPRALRLVVLALALFETGLRGAVVLENMRRDAGPGSTRELAADWIEANIKPGETVGLTRYPEPAHSPSWRFDLRRLVVFQTQNAPSKNPPRWLVLDEQGRVALESWTRDRYELAAEFPSFSLGRFRVLDDTNYANQPFYVLRRKMQ